GGGGGGGGGFVAVNGTLPDATKSTVTPLTQTVDADGVAQATYTVTANDKFGNNVLDVILQVVPSGTDTTVTISGPTNSKGVATFSATSTKGQTETFAITMFSAGNATGVVLGTSPTAIFQQVPSNQATSTLTANQTSATADGTSQIT